MEVRADRRSPSKGLGHVKQLDLVSATTGFAVGYGPSLYVTTDGGRTWRSLPGTVRG
jgi:photosystem II stability/assembly factor-like uncharacterized protein